MSTHFCTDGEKTACGIVRRHYPAMLQWTGHKLATTCEACQNTATFRAAVQRIPQVFGGPYRG